MINEMLYLAELAHPQEACGVLLDTGRVYPCRNIARNPRAQFELDPVDYAAAERLGRVVGIWHSHPDDTAEPSMLDRVMCERTGLPWHIVSWPNGEHTLTDPGGWQAPYEGRPFCWGMLDCFSLAQDWHRRETGILLPRAAAREDFWRHGENPFAAWLASAPADVVTDEIQRGDLIFMMCEADVINHVAVYVGDSRILHQLYNQPSQVSIYGGWWQRCTVTVVRPRHE
ncbi:hypothetical protein B0T37_10425 [Chromobacterium violaceum]|uniref:C40 family peptidase n=1 Tax=Chromobacterium violaceum TaxID=536 RepID=UPI0009D93894|nr:C40 family peptidase [Chromobacterium violaceum]OQS10056.1 hypothetical protein B0T38_10820 [Chromobacterium violaceum]OQS26471.1 hypothetical protein B0T37_10425 [Chromobacterium violaceum]